MVSSGSLRASWRLLVLALLISMVAVAGLGSPAARAASAAPGHVPAVTRPLAGCAPCIVAPVTPAANSTVMPDADGKVTISATAQLVNNYTKFFFILDNTTTIDTTKIQVTATDPTQPTGTYKATLTPGQHTVTVQVDDTMTAPAASYQWSFTVTAAAPTATATQASGGGGSTGGSGGNGGSSNPTSSGGFFSPTTLSIILFSIAGVGLLVITFIAGMWYGGRRWVSKHP